MSNFNLLMVVSLLLGTIDACQPTSRKEFTLERSKNGINTIYTNGLYYNSFDYQNKLQSIFFIPYQNGVLIGPIQGKGGIEYYMENVHESYNISVPYYWGIYKIDTDSAITIQRWGTVQMGPYPIITYKGKILNKETIYFPNSPLDTMRFMPLETKPDSTNPFVPYEEVQKRKKAIRYEHN